MPPFVFDSLLRNDTLIGFLAPFGSGINEVYVFFLETNFQGDTLYYTKVQQVVIHYKNISIDSLSISSDDCLNDTINLFW